MKTFAIVTKEEHIWILSQMKWYYRFLFYSYVPVLLLFIPMGIAVYTENYQAQRLYAAFFILGFALSVLSRIIYQRDYDRLRVKYYYLKEHNIKL